MFVTHDMDEALGLADRIAVIDHGRLAQLGTSLDLLTRPATEQVARLVGTSNRGLKLLDIRTVADRLQPGAMVPGEVIADDLSLSAALSEMITRNTDRLAVQAADGTPLGTLYLADLVRPE